MYVLVPIFCLIVSSKNATHNFSSFLIIHFLAAAATCIPEQLIIQKSSSRLKDGITLSSKSNCILRFSPTLNLTVKSKGFKHIQPLSGFIFKKLSKLNQIKL